MKTVEKIREEIAELAKNKGFSLSELSQKVDKASAYMHQYIKYGTPLRLPEDVRKKLAMALSVDEQDLTDIMLNDVNISQIENSNNMVSIDIIDATASCGYGIENFHPVIVGRQLITEDGLKEITNSKARNIKILKVRGDSMQPTINDSDVIWVDISYKAPAGDGLYLFCINGELFVKRLQIDFIKNNIIIKSDNTKYEPIIASANDNVEVLGKVISINKMLG